MAEFFDKHAENYSDEIDESLGKFGTSHDFFTEHKSHLIKDILQKRGRSLAETDLLDFGCGVGKIHTYLDKKYKSIVGTDVSPASLDVARQTYPHLNYRLLEGSRLPFEDSRFDLAIAICVFHHIPPENWVECAAEMLRVLRPDGLVLIIEHNPYNPVTRHIVNTCPLDEEAILLKPAKLRSLFLQAGAGQATTRTILSVPPKNSMLRSLDYALGLMPFGAQYYMIAEK